MSTINEMLMVLRMSVRDRPPHDCPFITLLGFGAALAPKVQKQTKKKTEHLYAVLFQVFEILLQFGEQLQS